ncbi:hypothetical protein HF325_006805 [Metschnikowia pulcherrima]|uniref:GPI-anchored wall transfer protein n=1 Tax=Metschnikowia pulcherrima TaxID=27326 RepID=A0A8H7L8X8_9ASCO|nr:hypothetical protein HF325_006805 [Metschnikowia pulcherrima]
MSSLKDIKEIFVSDLTGGLVLEIYAVTGTALAALVARLCVDKYLVPKVQILSEFPVLFILSFCFDVVIQLQAITILSGLVQQLYRTCGAICVGALVFDGVFGKILKVQKSHKSQKSQKTRHSAVKTGQSHDSLGLIPYITAYRAQMLIITNLAILAVDFHVFPRRFAKVETWGTSMMDLGVGLFVFSMGLANSRSIIKSQLSRDKKRDSYFKLVYKNTLKALPVLSLGMIRLVSVKSLEYQEHVTEYGVHWNFFITLGLLPIFLGILDPVFAYVPRFLVALAIGVIYECVLQFGLARFVLDETNRNYNLLTLNKEGLASFVGYLSIFIFGQSFGSFVLTTKKIPNNLIGIGLLKKTTLLLFGLFNVSDEIAFTGTISRRLANLSYVLWVVSYNSVMLLCYNVAEKVVGPVNSRIFNAINRNGLAIFLAANLATGCINMYTNTLAASDGVAYTILILYSLLWVSLALVLDHYRIYIKL